MKTLITALVLGAASFAPVAYAQSMVPTVPTQFPQDGAFEDGKGLLSILTTKPAS